MRLATYAMGALAFALAACSGGEDDSSGEPGALALTPGAWAANADQASYADEDGNLLATFRCDTETVEIVLEMPGGFAEGARPAMLVRAGDFMHGIDPVEVRNGPDGPVRFAPIPVVAPIARAVRDFPVPLTIEADGAEPVMVQTDAVLQEYFEQCAAASATNVAPAEQGQ
ncbi:MAG: hypothetical protein AAGE05_14780 [Pseudomonadota bacterium]